MRMLLTITGFFICMGIVNGQLWETDPHDTHTWRLYRFRITGGLSVTRTYGELGGSTNLNNLTELNDISFIHTRLNISAGVKYMILRNLSARGDLTFGLLNITGGVNTGKDFESKPFSFEPALLTEFYLFKHDEKLVLNEKPESVSILSLINLYLLTGLGTFSYKISPVRIIAPQAVRTDGVRMFVPVGLGVNINNSNTFNIGIELSRRFALGNDPGSYTPRYSLSDDVSYFLHVVIAYHRPKPMTRFGL